MSRGDGKIKRIKKQPLELISVATTIKKLETCSLSRKLVTPTVSTMVQANTNRSETHWT
jgi:hypothetical protein